MGERICGVTSLSGRFGEPLACGWKAGHDGSHSWSTLPTFVHGSVVDDPPRRFTEPKMDEAWEGNDG